MNRVLKSIALSLVLLGPVSQPAWAQGRWSWPEKPENVQVLGEDTGGQRLRAVMTGFTRALGVRCNHCHVGEEGQPFTEWDFASDDRPAKQTARLMLRMMETINEEYLSEVAHDGEAPVNFGCHTCHAGRPRPATLAEELDDALEEGPDAALARYHELRDRYHGRGAYDFGEAALNGLGYRMLQAGNVEGALRAFELNAEYFPESGNVYDSLAEAYMVQGKLEEAAASYRRSLELNPRNANARRKLESIEAPRD